MKTTFVSLAAVLAMATVSSAQNGNGDAITGVPFVEEVSPWRLQPHSSTLEEGVQRGFADVIRSRGLASVLSSEAAINYQRAYRDALDNELRATQVYFEKRRYNQDYRHANRSRPLSLEQYTRIARELAPDRLQTSQLDPFTGQINWPAPLLRPEYDDLRGHMETLFQARASGAILSYGEVRAACNDFLGTLLSDIHTFPQTDYIQARNFIASLAYEAQLALS